MVTIKRGDDSRTLVDQLTLGGTEIDLTGATVYLIWRQGGTVTRKAATITNASEGRVSYALLTADVATAGKVELEWEIEYGDGKLLTVPSEGYLELNIVADLG